MDRAAVVTTNAGGQSTPGNSEIAHSRSADRGWRAFLVSWQLGAILALACVLGLLAIFTAANPFSSETISERVTAAVGKPATCAELGSGAGEGSGVYRCTIDTGKQTVAKCFVLAEGEVKQFASNRRGC